MWELICHHEYRWGTIAADRSSWRSDGIPSSVEPIAGEDGLRFSQPGSRVQIPRRSPDVWDKLEALVLEMTIRIRQPGCTLIDIDRSFRLWMSNQRILFAQVAGRDVPVIALPLDQWIRLRIRHNGLNAIGFSYENVPGGGSLGGPVHNAPVGQVPPAGPGGVLIGNRVGHPNEHLRGDIAAVKIWRRDPRTMPNKFIERPLDPEQSECWANFLRKLKDALRDDVECAQWFAGTIRQLQQHFLVALVQRGPAKINEFYRLCEQYQQLWRNGDAGSPQMQALMQRIRDWLKAEGLVSFDNPHLTAIAGNACTRRIAALLPELDCDPQAKAIVEAMLHNP